MPQKHDATPLHPEIAGGQATVCVNCGRDLPVGASGMHRSVRWLGLCWACHHHKDIRDARRAAVGNMTKRPQLQREREGMTDHVLGSLDRNLEELQRTALLLEESARAAAAESAEVVERARRFGHELRERTSRARALMNRIDGNIRESNAELRRQAKAVGETRQSMAALKRVLPAVDHTGGIGDQGTKA